jgi:DNA polymerase III subunit delta'
MSYKFEWPIYGHQNQLQFLQQAIVSDKLANTYLFYGARGLGKKLVAKYFAKSLFCQDPKTKPCNKCYHCRLVDKKTFLDLHTLGSREGELSVESIREFLHKLSLSHVSGQKKLAIIYGIDKINLHGANALLKTLEEPPRNTSIILVADSIANLPSTVMSRCQLLKFKSLARQNMEDWLENFDFSQDEKQTIINLSFGKPGIALGLMEDNLTSFRKNCNFIIKLLSSDTWHYMQTIDKWFDVLKKEYPNFKVYELGNLTKQYLDLFEVFLRDLLWLKLDRPVVNQIYLSELQVLSESFTQEKLLNNLLSINNTKQKLRKNVSPQLLWENLLLNVK